MKIIIGVDIAKPSEVLNDPRGVLTAEDHVQVVINDLTFETTYVRIVEG